MKISLKRRMFILIGLISAIISLTAFVVISKGIKNTVTTLYERNSVDIAEAVAKYMEEDLNNVRVLKDTVTAVYRNTENKVLSDQWGTEEFDEYLSNFAFVENMAEYKEVVERMRKIQSVLEVDCIYLTVLDKQNLTYYYIADADPEEPCPPGVIDPVYDLDSPGLEDELLGFRPNVTNTAEYGWLVATFMPICDASGNYVCFACVDISMNEIMDTARSFSTIVAFIFLALSTMFTFIGMKIFDKRIVEPINTLSTAASEYVAGEENFKNIDIHTNDEIEVLSDSIKKMDNDVNDYIKQLVNAEDYSKKMEEEANVDALTHVRNKRAFDNEMDELKTYEGVYAIMMIDLNDLKGINDKFGHDKGDVAIKTISNTICKVFKHSPVFRVGGDEFVVVLKGDNFDKIKELRLEFENTLKGYLNDEGREEWERVSASYGYHVKVKNETPEDVLKIADARMYYHKNRMKKNRK